MTNNYKYDAAIKTINLINKVCKEREIKETTKRNQYRVLVSDLKSDDPFQEFDSFVGSRHEVAEYLMEKVGQRLNVAGFLYVMDRLKQNGKMHFTSANMTFSINGKF